MESLYFKPRNGPLQKVLVSELKNKVVFKFERKGENNGDDDAEPEVTGLDDIKKNYSGKVIKLYDQCMELLSHYTHCFESLVDFPEDFGREIFDRALCKLCKDNENTRKTVKIYCKAYPSTFLPQCKLNNLMMINNYELSLPVMLGSTTKLELSGCQLDDNHELFEQIVHLLMLEILCLANNKLTDKGLRKLLLPAMDGKYLGNLSYLDVSSNRLEKRALKRINLVPSLKTVVFGEKDFEKDELEMCLHPHFRLRKCPKFEKVETIGFGKSLLDKWEEASKVREKPEKISNGFYSIPRVSLGSVPISKKIVVRNKVMFEKVLVLGEIKTGVNKRKNVLGDNCNTGQKKLKLTMVEQSTNGTYNTVFEEELLSLYK